MGRAGVQGRADVGREASGGEWRGVRRGRPEEAITAAKNSTQPIELLVRAGDRYRTVRIDYHGGLRYPHLERDTAMPARLDDILAPR